MSTPCSFFRCRSRSSQNVHGRRTGVVSRKAPLTHGNSTTKLGDDVDELALMSQRSRHILHDHQLHHRSHQTLGQLTNITQNEDHVPRLLPHLDHHHRSHSQTVLVYSHRPNGHALKLIALHLKAIAISSLSLNDLEPLLHRHIHLKRCTFSTR